MTAAIAFLANSSLAYPMNMKRTILAVISAPRLAGLNIPNIANTSKRERERKKNFKTKTVKICSSNNASFQNS